MRKMIMMTLYKLSLLTAAAPFMPAWLYHLAEINLVFLYLKKLVTFYRRRHQYESNKPYYYCLFFMGGLSMLALITSAGLSYLPKTHVFSQSAIHLLHYMPYLTLLLSFAKLLFFMCDRMCRVEMSVMGVVYMMLVGVHVGFAWDMAYLLWSLSFINTLLLLYNQIWRVHQDFNRVNEIDIYQEALIGMHFY